MQADIGRLPTSARVRTKGTSPTAWTSRRHSRLPGTYGAAPVVVTTGGTSAERELLPGARLAGAVTDTSAATVARAVPPGL